MAKRRCNFQDRERKVLFSLYKIVKELDQKMDYVIEGQRDLYYSAKTKNKGGENALLQ